MKRVTITPVARVEVEHLGADAGLGRLARRDRLVGAVDVLLGALAGNAQADAAQPIDAVGQPAQPLDRTAVAGQHRDAGRRVQRDIVVHHRHPPASSSHERFHSFDRLAMIPQEQQDGRKIDGRRQSTRDRWARSTTRSGPRRSRRSTTAGPRPTTRDVGGGLPPSDDLPGAARPASAARRRAAARRRRRHRADRRMARHHGLSACRGAGHFRRHAGARPHGRAPMPRCIAWRSAVPCPSPTAHFAGIVSAGVFTSGHVGVEGLDELVRICRPGGVIVLTVKNTLWDCGLCRRHRGAAGDGVVSRRGGNAALRLDARRSRARCRAAASCCARFERCRLPTPPSYPFTFNPFGSYSGSRCIRAGVFSMATTSS